MAINLKLTILVAVLLLLCSSVYCINKSIASAQPVYSITVSKTSISDFAVTNVGSYTGSFDTTYIITGSEIDFEATKELLISSIVGDFLKSPTIVLIITIHALVPAFLKIHETLWNRWYHAKHPIQNR